MKSKVLFIILIIAIAVSVFFTYQRSFVWGNFETINSEEDASEDSVDMEQGNAAQEDSMLDIDMESATTTNDTAASDESL